MVNNWDRITGRLYPNQAYALRHMIPDPVRHRLLSERIARSGTGTRRTAPRSLFLGYLQLLGSRGTRSRRGILRLSWPGSRRAAGACNISLLCGHDLQSAPSVVYPGLIG